MGPLMTQVVSTLHFEAKHLALHTAGLQSELCLGVQLVCLLGSVSCTEVQLRTLSTAWPWKANPHKW